MILDSIFYRLGDVKIDEDGLRQSLGRDVADRILQTSGFSNRFIVSPEQSIFDLGRTVIEEESLRSRIIQSDVVIVVSEFTRNLVPPPSSLLFDDFKFRNTLVLDFNRGCSGFCEALVVARQFLEFSGLKSAVIVTAECYSTMISRTNRTLAPIFSDCVAFTFLRKGNETAPLLWEAGADHSLGNNLAFDVSSSELFMNGRALVSFVKTSVVPSIERLLARNSEMGYFVCPSFFPHQGSKLVVEQLNHCLGNRGLSAAFTASDVGNTNSSSIPISLKKLVLTKRPQGEMSFLLSGFGVGLSYCNVLTKLAFDNANS